MRRLILTSIVAFICMTMQGQEIRNEYIIQAADGQLERLVKKYMVEESIKVSVLSKDLSVLHLVLSDRNINLERALLANPAVVSWGYNHEVEQRLAPDDQYFDMQWGLDLINAPAAWEVTTGGTDFYGREIVVAVMDESFDFSHPDLEGVIFENEGEIEGDGIDNDNNGYIDDFHGWNSTDLNGTHITDTNNHGNAVMGIIGAKGDNGVGISGVNWNVKILPISGIATQAEVISGYQYIIDMRRRYNETDGAEGAYVVASNYSAGINNAFGTLPQFATWCGMYDKLAEVGVLSVGATSNRNINVDADGDMPTTCPSEFLMAVTNTDVDDIKVPAAGYGQMNIDLGAPGKGTFALDVADGYDIKFGGTSAATPHVSGTIALLYSVPCQALADLATSEPLEAARLVRQAIYEGTQSNTTLTGITATGGRLDVVGAMEQLQNVCQELELPSLKGELDIKTIKARANNRLEIAYLTPDESEYNLMITDRLGRVVHKQEFVPPSIGSKILNIQTVPLNHGIYFISIYNNAKINTKKRYIHN